MDDAVGIVLEIVLGIVGGVGQQGLAVPENGVKAALLQFVGDRIHQRDHFARIAQILRDMDFGQTDEMEADAFQVFLGFQRPLGKCDPAGAAERKIVVRLQRSAGLQGCAGLQRKL